MYLIITSNMLATWGHGKTKKMTNTKEGKEELKKRKKEEKLKIFTVKKNKIDRQNMFTCLAIFRLIFIWSHINDVILKSDHRSHGIPNLTNRYLIMWLRILSSLSSM